MITPCTALYCVLGSPVSHSLSPLVHNIAFQAHGVDAVYVAFEPDTAERAAQALGCLGISGASVTLPFKEEILAHLDRIDPLARKIGAVNTVVNRNGVLWGYNTDCQAALAPLKALGSIQGKTVCVIGAGGAARAVAHGLAMEKARVIITNRTRERGQALARAVAGTFVPRSHVHTCSPNVVINTTSLGMTGRNSDPLPFPLESLCSSMVVMDVVYTPLDTPLLIQARQKKCTVIDGLAMFTAQAAAQFKLWTGIEPDIKTMRQAVLSHQRSLTDKEI